jgi:hypothetical protein
MNPEEETLRYRAENTLSNFGFTDEEVDEVVKEWIDCEIPEGSSPDLPIVLLEKIAHRHLQKKKGLWEKSRAYRITYPLPKED